VHDLRSAINLIAQDGINVNVVVLSAVIPGAAGGPFMGEATLIGDPA
jgi:hypothetical protein